MESTLLQKRIRGLNTAWWRSGLDDDTAPIAILFHGFPDSPATWEAQRKMLDTQFTVIRPLLRGTAESETPRRGGKGKVDVHRYRRKSLLLDHLEILRTIDATGKRRVVVFGHDIGGIAAWELALALGPRALGLVLVAGMGLEMFWNRKDRLVQHWKSWYMYLLQVPVVPERVFSWFGPQILHRIYSGAYAGAHADAAQAESHLEEVLPHVPAMLGHYRAGALDVRGMKPEAKRLACPLLVLWGDRDPFLASVTTDEWRGFASDTQIRVLDAGHWPHREKAVEVNRLVSEFLQTQFARGAA